MPDQDPFAKWAKPTTGVADPFAKWSAPEAPSAPEDSGLEPWMVGAGAAALGAGAYALTRNPGAASKVFNAFNDARRMSMLSGLAPIKSLLGNIGGSAYASIERGSMKPLAEMLSPETMRDAWQTFKAGPNYAGSGPATGLSKFNLPGRIMGSLDTASQNALQRAGLSSKEAAAEMLQAPLPAAMTEKLKGPVADYLLPFRRTPFNQLFEGFSAMAPKNLQTTGQKLALGTSVGTGAATGATAEDPKTVALGTALSGRRGLPFALAAGATRALTSGSKRTGAEALQGLSPVSDYSLSEGVLGPVMDPTKLIPKPAAVNAITYLRSLLGMD